MKVNTSTIAQKAGVSRVTVDKVIHNRPGVSEATRKRILEIIEELNYIPPQQRKKAAAGEKKLRLAVLLPDTDDSYAQKLQKGIRSACQQMSSSAPDLNFYFCNPYDPLPMEGILQYLLRNPVDGVILRAISDNSIRRCVRELTAASIPVFTVDADIEDSGRICFLGEDLYQTGRISASMLCRSIGYRGKVALFIGSRNVETSSLRLQGFQDYLADCAPAVEVVAIVETMDQHIIAYREARRLLTEHPDMAGLWNAVSCGEDVARAAEDMEMADRVCIGTLLLNRSIYPLIRQGVIDYTLALVPFEMGRKIIGIAAQYIRQGIRPEQEHIESPAYIAIDANIDQLSKEYPL